MGPLPDKGLNIGEYNIKLNAVSEHTHEFTITQKDSSGKLLGSYTVRYNSGQTLNEDAIKSLFNDKIKSLIELQQKTGATSIHQKASRETRICTSENPKGESIQDLKTSLGKKLLTAPEADKGQIKMKLEFIDTFIKANSIGPKTLLNQAPIPEEGISILKKPKPLPKPPPEAVQAPAQKKKKTLKPLPPLPPRSKPSPPTSQPLSTPPPRSPPPIPLSKPPLKSPPPPPTDTPPPPPPTDTPPPPPPTDTPPPPRASTRALPRLPSTKPTQPPPTPPSRTPPSTSTSPLPRPPLSMARPPPPSTLPPPSTQKSTLPPPPSKPPIPLSPAPPASDQQKTTDTSLEEQLKMQKTKLKKASTDTNASVSKNSGTEDKLTKEMRGNIEKMRQSIKDDDNTNTDNTNTNSDWD